ncbi:Uncharacterized protein KIAA0930 [Trichoplax sp. H2]|nr:Uncharacterized protein KIAA0930 [Trichoplax sp. H2]|eukprot:RDD42866.1 Uncharacterized protein KIAA0930 [Trichoplax sp. H2]
MAGDQARDESFSLLQLLNQRHQDKYKKGRQVDDDRQYHQHFKDNVLDVKSPTGDQDDLLFFVKRCMVDEEVIVTESRKVQVYRRTTKNLPSSDSLIFALATVIDDMYSAADEMVLWDETVCLNMILQNFNYIITMAASNNDNATDIIKRWSHTVFASPNKRRMDSKGDTSENIDYPNIYFYIDEFEEVFKDFTFGHNQHLAIELVAVSKAEPAECRVIFQGSVRFQVAWEHFVKKQSETGGTGMLYRMLERVRYDGRDSFVRFAGLNGPDGRGRGEVALRRAYEDGNTEVAKADIDPEGHSPNQNTDHNTAINWKRISPSKEIQKLKMKGNEYLLEIG